MSKIKKFLRKLYVANYQNGFLKVSGRVVGLEEIESFKPFDEFGRIPSALYRYSILTDRGEVFEGVIERSVHLPKKNEFVIARIARRETQVLVEPPRDLENLAKEYGQEAGKSKYYFIDRIRPNYKTPSVRTSSPQAFLRLVGG